jgi:eukaryotic-like serine/threonine-protein kinase
MQSSFALLSQSAPIQLPFEPGEVIAGKYEMIGLIGSGGMGYVVSARHIELGELVAIKFLRSEALAYDELVGRFAREARASVRIKSEHVARVYDVGNLPNGIPFIVMEHLEGKDLGDVLQEHGRLPIKIAVEYVMQACEALASAHAVGTIHRDVKPENLFLARQAQGVDVVKVLDFGISKVAHDANWFAGVYVTRADPLVRKRGRAHRHLVDGLCAIRIADRGHGFRRADPDGARSRYSG